MQATIVYRHNTNPVRWLGVVGIFGIKALLAVPHLVLVSALGTLAWWSGYIGYFLVAFTGSLPTGLQEFMTWWLRWWVRAYGWIAGIDDLYPPFDPDPADYGIDADVPRNAEPSTGWAVAGIFFVKFIAAIPHFIIVALLAVISFFAAWFGYFAVAFTGKLPVGIQDFVAGTMQWSLRVMVWVLGLDDEYPPFQLKAEARQPAG